VKLHEYQSKRIFAKYGVPIPEGDVATTASEARQIARRLGGPVVIKSQVLVGGRGKAGGIKLAKDEDEAESLADGILGMTIKGLSVDKVLVDQAADIREEIYLGITIDRTQRKPVMMASSEGGVEIEEVAKATPEKIFKLAIDPAMGLMDYQARNLAFDLGMRRAFIRQFTTCSATKTWPNCATYRKKQRPSARPGRLVSPTSNLTARSAVWSTVLVWPWLPWTSSSCTAPNRPTSWTSAAGPSRTKWRRPWALSCPTRT
jgi:hypothetical protein